MTEKVVSLSGGLVLGMVFALFLGIGATQRISPSAHFEIPSVLRMTIAQNTQGTSASDTTPSVDVDTPSNEDRGRITRIATLTETTDPAFTPATTSSVQAEPKNWVNNSTPKVDNGLRMANLQHASIASNTGSASSCAVLDLTTARQGNFTTIACSSSGQGGYGSGSTPYFVGNKPQSHGSPAIAQNNPDNDPQGNPSFSGGSAKPGIENDPDFLPNDQMQRGIDPVSPGHSDTGIPNIGGQSENDPGNPMISQSPRRRPETD